MIPNHKGYKILTPNGYEDFAGVAHMGIKQTYKVSFAGDSYIKASSKHRLFYSHNHSPVFLCDLKVGDVLWGEPDKVVESITLDEIVDVYDIIETESHTFIANGVVSHNCVFISTDPLLFDSMLVTNYVLPPQPELDARGITWYSEINPKIVHLLAIDPSTGSGSDYTVFSMYTFPGLEQVMEYRTNTTSTPSVYLTLKFILKKMAKLGCRVVYWSLENNGCGEGLIAMYQSDDDAPHVGELVSEPGKNRVGFNTGGKSKPKSCITLKNLFETNKLQVKSENALTEMRDYVRKSGSYAARAGATDDCISSLLVLVRMLQEIVDIEDAGYDVLYGVNETSEFESVEKDDFDVMPMLIGDSVINVNNFAPTTPTVFDPWALVSSDSMRYM